MAAKKEHAGLFVKGHDPRRGQGRPAPRAKPPKKPSITETAAINRGDTPEQVEEAKQAGRFQPGPDPRRMDAARWAEKMAAGGPKPSIVRAASRLGLVERLPWLLDVIDGVPQKVVKRVREKDKKGDYTGKYITVEYEETPAIKERLVAFHELVDMGGVKTMSITDGEGGELPPSAPAWVLSNLSLEQLKQMEQLSILARPKALQAGLDPAMEVK